MLPTISPCLRHSTDMKATNAHMTWTYVMYVFYTIACTSRKRIMTLTLNKTLSLVKQTQVKLATANHLSLLSLRFGCKAPKKRFSLVPKMMICSLSSGAHTHTHWFITASFVRWMLCSIWLFGGQLSTHRRHGGLFVWKHAHTYALWN